MPEMMPYDQEVITLLAKKEIAVTTLFWEEVAEKKHSLEPYDLVLVRTIWNYYKSIPLFYQLLEILENSIVPIFNPTDILRWNMDKRYLQELQKEGFDIIPSLFVYDGDNKNVFESAVGKGWKKIVLKPMISAGSYHTFVIDAGDKQRFSALVKRHYQNRPFILQEFLPEIAQGEISTIRFHNGYTYSATKIPKAGDYRVQFDYGGKYHLRKVDSTIRIVADRISKRLNNKVIYQRVDGLWREGKFLIMEVELIEPDLYLNLSKEAMHRWIENIEQIVSTL